MRPYFPVWMNEETRLSTLTFTAWADAFTPAEVERGVAYGDSLMPQRRVSPVISGIRKPLVVWTTGPKVR